MIAGILMKPLPKHCFEKLLNELGMKTAKVRVLLLSEQLTVAFCTLMNAQYFKGIFNYATRW